MNKKFSDEELLEVLRTRDLVRPIYGRVGDVLGVSDVAVRKRVKALQAQGLYFTAHFRRARP